MIEIEKCKLEETPLKKVGGFRRHFDKYKSPSKSIFTLPANKEESREFREKVEKASKDPEFLKDCEESMRDFENLDNE